MVPSISAARESCNTITREGMGDDHIHTPSDNTHTQPHHRVQSQGMVASRGSCRVVSVPQVLQLLLGFMQHLYTLWIFLLQLLKLFNVDIKIYIFLIKELGKQGHVVKTVQWCGSYLCCKLPLGIFSCHQVLRKLLIFHRILETHMQVWISKTSRAS